MSHQRNVQKVMIISPVHSYDDSRIFHKQAVSLVKAGYLVELHANAPFDEKEEQGVHIKGITRANKKYKRLKNGWILYQRAVSSQADFFHFHDPEWLPWAILLARKTGRPVIYDVHEDLPKQIHTKPWIPRLIRSPLSRFAHKVEKALARRLSAVVTATQSIADQFDNPCTVIHNYPLPIPSIPKETEETDQNQILYVGGISYLRGYLEMIQMMKYIPEKHQAKLHMIGPLQHISEEDQCTEKLEEQGVYLHGRIPFQEVAKWLSKGKVGLVCLHPIENYRESLPIKMFEYMAAGLPFVATDFPLWKAIAEESNAGLVANALDPRDIAEKVVKLLEDSKLHQQMSVNGVQAFKEKYNWGVEEKKLWQLYQELGGQNEAAWQG